MFVRPDEVTTLENIVRHYALLDSPEERGAQKHRCKFVLIDAERGSATGYVAKYISKNIDGYKLDTDSTGEPAITASVHVMAWDKTHGIRQFQAFGAGSITVWREFRRIPFSVVKDAPEHVQKAWQATQKHPQVDGDSPQRADYSLFLNAMGGAGRSRKDATIRLAKVHYDTLGRYGEAMGEKPIGIYAIEAPLKIYESIRYRWERVDAREDVIKAIAIDGAAQGKAALQKLDVGFPWTRVNNCTDKVIERHKMPFKKYPYQPEETFVVSLSANDVDRFSKLAS